MGYNNYRLVGTAAGYSCGDDGVEADAYLGQVLDQVRDAGATVVRTWFFQSYYAAADPSEPFAPFDRVLDACAARGMRVIPVLTNHFADCELRGREKDISFYAGGYRSAEAPFALSYRSYAATVAAHYRGNPTVAFWQLVNEAEAPTLIGEVRRCYEDPAAAALRAFTEDMVAVVKAADPDHLVGIGTIGTGQCGAIGDHYLSLHAGGVDLCEYHDYHSPTQAIPDDGANRLRQRLDQCAALGKPFLMGESGIMSDVAEDGSASGVVTAETLRRRARFFRAKLAAAFAAGVDGYLLWEALLHDDPGGGARYGIGPGDPTYEITRQVDARLSADSRPRADEPT